jgi:hypothetical protein
MCFYYCSLNTWIQIINQIITHLYRVVHANKHATRLTRLVPLVEQELLTLPEHLSPPPHSGVLCGSCYSIFNFMCMFCRLLFVLLYFFFWPLYVVCFSWMNRFWLNLWYLQTLLIGLDFLYTNNIFRSDNTIL